MPFSQIKIMGRWYDCVLDRWVRESDDSLDCSYVRSGLSTTGTGTRALVTPFDGVTGTFTLPAMGTPLAGWVNDPAPSYSTLTRYLLPGSDGFAGLTPPIRNPPDSSNVCLTLLPVMVASNQALARVDVGNAVPDSSKVPFGWKYPIVVVPSLGAVKLRIPITYPTLTTTPFVVWTLSPGGATPAFTLSFGSSNTLLAHDVDGNLHRFSYSVDYGGGSPGTNYNAQFILTNTTTSVFYIVAFQLPLRKDLTFLPVACTTPSVTVTVGGPSYQRGLLNSSRASVSIDYSEPHNESYVIPSWGYGNIYSNPGTNGLPFPSVHGSTFAAPDAASSLLTGRGSINASNFSYANDQYPYVVAVKEL